jgi:uncharacterized protein YoaH (UPF0181 family)
MADVTKEKILRINTQGAEKNVKTLKTQIRELKEQLAGLEKGTEEYNRVAKQLADTNQKQIEINEAMKYSNKDLGATLSNLTKVSAGVVGSISAINGVMTLMGADSEEAQKAMMRIQSLMAIIQGMSAIDTAVKALNGLRNAFSGLGKVKAATAGNTMLSAGAETAEASALLENTKRTKDNNTEADLYNEAQIKNIEATDLSTQSIIDEGKALGLNTAKVEENVAWKTKAESQLKRIEAVYKSGAISEEQYNEMVANVNKSVAQSEKNIEAETRALRDNINARRQQVMNMNGGAVSENANTNATNQNTNAKNRNTIATNANAKSQKAANVATAGSVPTLKNATKGVKGLTGAFQGLSKAIPWLLAISVAVGLISSMFGQASEEEEKMKQRLQDYQDMLNNINKTIEEGKVHVDVLLNRLSSNPSLAEKEAIVKELNKEVPDLNAKIDETTKAVTYSEDALAKYNKQLEARTKLKAYESQLADLKAQREEYDLMMRIAQHSPLKKKEWEEAKKNLTQVENMIKSIELEIGRINLADALNTDKKDSGGGVKTVVRTVKEMLVDIKALYKEILGDMTKIADTKNIFGDSYDALDALRNKIYELTAGSIGTKAGEAFTSQFVEGIENEFKGLDISKLTVDQVFNRDMVDTLVQQLVEEEQLLAKYLNKEIKVSESVIKKQKEKVTALTLEVNTIREIIDAVVNLGKEEEKQLKKEKELKKWNRDLEQTKELYYELRADTRSNNPFAEINQNISKATFSLQNLNEELRDLNEEEQRLSTSPQTQVTKDRLEEIAKRRRELTLEQFNLENELEEAMYQKRLIDIQALMDEQEKKANEQNWQNEEYNLDRGQTDNYNTELQSLQVQLQMLENQKAAVEQYYADLMGTVEEFSEQWVVLEQEKNAAIEELDKQHAEKQVQIDQETSRRRLNIAKTYVNAYQTISTQTLNIMGAIMDGMDENTQEYKNMKYAQGVIDTLSGTLAGFMSGVDSGLPAPWNLVLAAATAASVFATGMIQLSNIKNEKLANGAQSSANTGSFGEYDTLSYVQNSEILGNIQDSRVYVVESDITSTQNRVQVAETQATF